MGYRNTAFFLYPIVFLPFIVASTYRPTVDYWSIARELRTKHSSLCLAYWLIRMAIALTVVAFVTEARSPQIAVWEVSPDSVDGSGIADGFDHDGLFSEWRKHQNPDWLISNDAEDNAATSVSSKAKWPAVFFYLQDAGQLLKDKTFVDNVKSGAKDDDNTITYLDYLRSYERDQAEFRELMQLSNFSEQKFTPSAVRFWYKCSFFVLMLVLFFDFCLVGFFGVLCIVYPAMHKFEEGKYLETYINVTLLVLMWTA